MEILNKAKELIHNIIDYSRSQNSIWQKIPYWALMADGRIGFNDNNSRAYYYGYWALDSSIGRYRGYHIYVDLENGNLVNPSKIKEQAYDEYILKLALNLKEIDANLLLKDLLKRAKSEYGSYYNEKDIEKTEKMRKDLIEKLDLNENFYKRKYEYKPSFGID